MKPIFTVHAGEFIVGDRITRMFRNKYNVWVPATDTGVDLLVTHVKKQKRPISIQVKQSRSFSRMRIPRELFVARGWFTINQRKVRKTKAEWWVFVVSISHNDHRFVIVPRKEVKKRIGRGRGTQHLYLTFLKDGRCIDTRELGKARLMKALYDGAVERKRDWSDFVDDWKSMLPRR